MSRGPLRRRLSGAPWISLGVSMLWGGGGGVQVVVWGLGWFTGERSSWEGLGGDGGRHLTHRNVR